MPVYELSIDPSLVAQAEKVVSLEGRGYPTLVMQWESRLFDQAWTTTIVLDYAIALPPLILSQATFNDVRIAAYVGGAATKYLYFGTEMSASVPRVAPEMENTISPAKAYQEFRLDEHTCPVPYLKLIQTAPKIYGDGPQDYYSPPIKVERFDGVESPQHLADVFPTLVANLDPIRGDVLTDPARGHWTGARYVGISAIAILRERKVVGLHRRTARPEKEPVPAIVRQRDPKLDVLEEWVGVDVGARSTVVGLRGERGAAEIVRIGASGPPAVAADFETPSEVAFEGLGRATKAWRDRVIQPMTRWQDVVVGHEARAFRTRPGPDLPARAAASLPALPLLRERIERGQAIKLRGRGDPETNEALKKPAPPIIDEDGIGAHDPFDPIELFAYYAGLTVNQRARGLHTRYVVTMPAGWTDERRQSVLVAFRRGFFRSLPAGLVEYHDLESLKVHDGGPAAIPFVVQAFRAFGVQPKPDESATFCAVDAGASEMGIVCGVYRPAKPDEREDGLVRMIEYLEPTVVPWFGGERLLHRLAHRAYVASFETMREARIAFEPAPDEPVPDGAAELFGTTPEARANATILIDVLRPVLHGEVVAKLPTEVRLASVDGAARDVPIAIDRQAASDAIAGWIGEAVEAIRAAIDAALGKIGKDPDPYDGFRIFLGGRLGVHPALHDGLVAAIPSSAKVHRYREPDKTNVTAATVKTACVLGLLAMRVERIGAKRRAETRDAFKWRFGRSRHGQLADALDPSVEYDIWREMGACSKPEVEVLFMSAVDDGEVAADDPRVSRALCRLGADAVGQRLYARAVGPSRVEVSVGPPGGEPQAGAPCWAVDLGACSAEPI